MQIQQDQSDLSKYYLFLEEYERKFLNVAQGQVVNFYMESAERGNQINKWNLEFNLSTKGKRYKGLQKRDVMVQDYIIRHWKVCPQWVSTIIYNNNISGEWKDIDNFKKLDVAKCECECNTETDRHSYWCKLYK